MTMTQNGNNLNYFNQKKQWRTKHLYIKITITRMDFGIAMTILLTPAEQVFIKQIHYFAASKTEILFSDLDSPQVI